MNRLTAMTRFLMRPSLSALLFLACLPPAFGQSRSELPNRSYLTLQEQSAWLLNYKGVKAGLKLSATEQQGISEAFRDYSLAEQRALDKHKGITDAQNEFLDHNFSKEALDALSAQHRERLLEILLQVKGAEGLVDPKIAKKVGLSGAEMSRLQKILETAQAREEQFEAALTQKVLSVPRTEPKKRLALIQSAEPDRAALAMKRNADEMKAISSLTPAQKKRWESLLGAPFPLTRYRD